MTAVVGEPPVPAEPSPEAGVGELIGRYVVLELAGRGGMGRVFKAYDPKLQREVAIKEIRPRVTSADTTISRARSRIISEARAMAMLSHANVVGVYDVEELPDDRLVLIMEFVDGSDVRAWLKQGERTPGEILSVFVGAGRGLAAAHGRDLLHRDFKPANVLIAADGVVKVTDFGLAKELGADEASALRVSDDTTFDGEFSSEATRAGVVMGTPRYMAPEQHRGETLTPAADQYAFCLALWQALEGAPPFDARGSQALLEAKLQGPPARGPAGVSARVANAVRRGLDPEPSQRWPDMDALLEVLSQTPTKRSWGWWGATGVAGAAVVLFAASRSSDEVCTGADEQLAGVWDEASKADVTRAFAEVDVAFSDSARERIVTGLDAYADNWKAAHREACLATTVRGEQSPEILDRRMGCLGRSRLELEATVRVLRDADLDVVRRAGALVDGLPALARCEDLDALRDGLDPPGADEEESVANVRGLIARSKSERTAGRTKRARAVFEQAEELSETVGWEPLVDEIALERGSVLEAEGKYMEAEAALRHALQGTMLRRRWPMVQIIAGQLLYVVGVKQRRMDEGLRYRELAEQLIDDDPLAQAGVANNLGLLFAAQGRYDEAERQHRTALEIRQRELGPQHYRAADSHSNLGLVYRSKGEFKAAAHHIRQAVEIYENDLGKSHPVVATGYTNMGLVYANDDEIERAEAEFRRALALVEPILGKDHPECIQLRSNIAASFAQRGELESAASEMVVILAAWERALGPEHAHVAVAYKNLGAVYSEMGKLDQAEPHARRALEIQVGAFGPDHPQVAGTRYLLSEILFARDKLEEARAEAELAWAYESRPDVLADDRGPTAFLLAQILAKSGERERALDLAQRGIEAEQGRESPSAEAVSMMRRWIEDQ